MNGKSAEKVYRSVKEFAVAENAAVVVEAGVDRCVEKLDTRRPQIEHIKHAFAVEKYADNILLLYREGYYNADDEESALEVNVAKNNAGGSGVTVLKFDVEAVQTTIYVPKITDTDL